MWLTIVIIISSSLFILAIYCIYKIRTRDIEEEKRKAKEDDNDGEEEGSGQGGPISDDEKITFP